MLFFVPYNLLSAVSADSLPRTFSLLQRNWDNNPRDGALPLYHQQQVPGY